MHDGDSARLRRAAAALLSCLAMNAGAQSLDIQGHRGARGLLPENTLPGFARALELGVTTLELDCAVTRDGVVVVSHDPALNSDITRGPDGRWLEGEGPAIAAIDYAELLRYDVGRIRPGSAYALRFPRQRPVDGARIPKLAEVFALARGAGDHAVRFNIETKLSPLAPGNTVTPEAFVDRLLSVIRHERMEKRVTIQSFDWRTLRLVQEKAPEIPTVYLTAQQDFMDNILARAAASPWTAGLHVSQFGGSIPRMVRAAGGAVWSPYYREVTAESVAEAHSLGLKVVVWTVNGAAEMRRMIRLGVDGIITDYPDRLMRVAARMGRAARDP
jgi:glycerophosphoryl diester phosphodiesterase